MTMILKGVKAVYRLFRRAGSSFGLGGGGGGGQRPKGTHVFFCQWLISGVASFLVWGWGRVPNVSTQNCTSDARKYLLS